MVEGQGGSVKVFFKPKITQLRDVSKKKTGKCGNFEKKTGGGLPESHFHFLLFLTWETPPKKVLKCKINHDFFSQTNVSFPNRGEGGGPELGKIPTFSRFFFGDVPYV